jgi:hypothetical protein
MKGHCWLNGQLHFFRPGGQRSVENRPGRKYNGLQVLSVSQFPSQKRDAGSPD